MVTANVPSCVSMGDTKLPSKQLKIYGLIIDNWNNAINEGKETLVLMDSNIDPSSNC